MSNTPKNAAFDPEAPLNIRMRGIKLILPSRKLLFAIKEFYVQQGSHILIQGPSGSGKTSLLHLMAGLFLPTEGEVLVGQDSLNKLSDDKRCELRRHAMGVIFQKLNVLNHLTIEENLKLVALDKNRAERRPETENILNRLNLGGRGNELCSHLSLGEQQRVAVARVLMQKPPIILADEPTSSLDQDNARFVMTALKEAALGKTLIVVSHDQRIAEHFKQVVPFLGLLQ